MSARNPKTKPEVTLPTDDEVPALTDRLVEVKLEIERLTAEKKQLEARLEAYALAHNDAHEPLKDAHREGRRFSLPGRRYRLPVVFSSDLLIQSFPEDSARHKLLLEVLEEAAGERSAGEVLKLFFDPPTKWTTRHEDGAKFRAAAAEWLPPAVAAKFVAACRQEDKHGIAKSRTSFDFKDASEIDAPTA